MPKRRAKVREVAVLLGRGEELAVLGAANAIARHAAAIVEPVQRGWLVRLRPWKGKGAGLEKRLRAEHEEISRFWAEARAGLPARKAAWRELMERPSGQRDQLRPDAVAHGAVAPTGPAEDTAPPPDPLDIRRPWDERA